VSQTLSPQAGMGRGSWVVKAFGPSYKRRKGKLLNSIGQYTK
jgi:hypothetical protein